MPVVLGKRVELGAALVVLGLLSIGGCATPSDYLDHPDPQRRVVAVTYVQDQGQLIDIALHDASRDVRRQAVSQLSADAALGEVVEKSEDVVVRSDAIERLDLDAIDNEAVLLVVALQGRNEEQALAAAARLEGPSGLSRIALEGEAAPVRLHAIQRLDDQALLGRLAVSDVDRDCRVAATRRLTDQGLLRRIALGQVQGTPERGAAVEVLTDPVALADVIRHSSALDLSPIRKLEDPDLLRELALEFGTSRPSVLEAIIEQLAQPADRVTLVLAADALDSVNGRSLSNFVVERMTDQEAVKELISSATQGGTRIAAVRRCADQELLLDLALNSWELGGAATLTLTDQDLVERVAWDSARASTRRLAVGRLTEEARLLSLALGSSDEGVVADATKALREQGSLIEIARWPVETEACFAALGKLDETSLEQLADDGSRPAHQLAAQVMLGRRSWDVRYKQFRTMGDDPDSDEVLLTLLGAGAAVATPLRYRDSLCRAAIRRGLDDALPLLLAMMHRHGDKRMAEVFFESRLGPLVTAAREWADENGMKFHEVKVPGVRSGGWGSGR